MRHIHPVLATTYAERQTTIDYLGQCDGLVAMGRAGVVAPAPEIECMAGLGRLAGRYDEVSRLTEALDFIDGLQRVHGQDAKLLLEARTSR